MHHSLYLLRKVYTNATNSVDFLWKNMLDSDENILQANTSCRVASTWMFTFSARPTAPRPSMISTRWEIQGSYWLAQKESRLPLVFMAAAGIVDNRWHQCQICHRYQRHRRYRWQNFLPVLVPLIPVVVHLELWISPRIFEKIQNDPYVIFRGLG